jgi:hypothetical protein
MSKTYIGGGHEVVQLSGVENGQQRNDVADLLDGHSVEDFWLDGARMMAKSGLPGSLSLPRIPYHLTTTVLATVFDRR